MSLFTNSIKHPKEFNLNTGKTDLVGELNSINQSIGLILKTTKGELYGDPEFGCNLVNMLFDNMNDDMSLSIKLDILNALTQFEPRITLSKDDVVVKKAENSHVTYDVKIHYALARSDYEADYMTVISEETYNF